MFVEKCTLFIDKMEFFFIKAEKIDAVEILNIITECPPDAVASFLWRGYPECRLLLFQVIEVDRIVFKVLESEIFFSVFVFID